MIKLLNTENYLNEKYSVRVGMKDYEAKVPSLADWLFIRTLDFTKLDRNFRDRAKLLFDIMLPSIEIEVLNNFEVVEAISKCFEILSERSKKDIEEVAEETAGTFKEEDEVQISFDYLVTKYCRYTNSSIKEALKTNVFIFFGILNGIDALIAEESLRLAEIFDNHLHLKSKDGSYNYKKTLDKYRNSLEKGVKFIAGIDTKGLNDLKALLERGR